MNSAPRGRGGRALCWLTLCLVLATPVGARADRVDRLIKMLTPDRDPKVRLQIVLVLGKLKSRRAVPALVKALDDPTPVVRGMAVLALLRVRDPSAVGPLRQRLSRETDANVKVRLRRALGALEPPLVGPPAGVRHLVALGTLQNRSRVSSAEIARVLEDSLHREFRGVSHITTRLGIGRPTRKTLEKHGLSGYVLDATVKAAGATPQGDQMLLWVQVDYTLRPMANPRAGVTFPGNARHLLPPKQYRKKHLVGHILDLMEVSARAARGNITQRFLPAK